MTRLEFIESAQRVSRSGNLLMWVTGSGILVLATVLLLWAEPAIRLGGQQLQNDWVAGLLFGLIGSVVLSPLVLLLLLPVWWVDRRFGVRCPHCGRSVTLRCHHSRVVESGRCCKCQGFLFEP